MMWPHIVMYQCIIDQSTALAQSLGPYSFFSESEVAHRAMLGNAQCQLNRKSHMTSTGVKLLLAIELSLWPHRRRESQSSTLIEFGPLQRRFPKESTKAFLCKVTSWGRKTDLQGKFECKKETCKVILSWFKRVCLESVDEEPPTEREREQTEVP